MQRAQGSVDSLHFLQPIVTFAQISGDVMKNSTIFLFKKTQDALSACCNPIRRWIGSRAIHTINSKFENLNEPKFTHFSRQTVR